MNLFKKTTKWQVLVTYNQGGVDYIVFCCTDIKSGMLYFKTKKITPLGTCSYNFNSQLFDIKKSFENILNQTK